MLRIMSVVAIVGVLSGSAVAQTTIVIPRDREPAAAPKQNAPVLPGTNSVPGPDYPSPAQKRLDTPSAGGGGGGGSGG